MSLSWSVLALALMGAQDQPLSQPRTPGSSITIAIDIHGPQMVQSESCRKAATAIAVQPDVNTAATAAQKAGEAAKLVGFCIERGVALVVDGAKAAVIARLMESPVSAAKLATRKTDVLSAPPTGLLSSTLPMQLPRVAKPRTTGDPEAAEAWPLTLPEALRIALDNSEVVRVIAFGGQGIPIESFGPTELKAEAPPIEDKADTNSIVIARLNADVAVYRFKAEMLAEVRSVEQQYWSLAQAHVRLWAADRAVKLAQEVLNQEAEHTTCHGTVADAAEAAQRLEQFKLDLVNRTSDVIAAERQLRDLLGLPPADNRRIIPITPATEPLIEYDWDTCLSEMRDNQPDIVQQKLLVRLAEMRLWIARNQLVPRLDLKTLYQLDGSVPQWDSTIAVMTRMMLEALDPHISEGEKAAGRNANPGDANGFPNWQTGFCYQMPMGVGRSPLANSRQAQYFLLRSRAYLKQIEHQTTHSLARSFLEVDANYKQFKTSSRLRTAAAQRLDAQRACYKEGRITADRLLDAVSQYAAAVATEAQYRSTYNVSLAALAEAKGTLLADRNIAIAEGPRRVDAYAEPTKSRKPVPSAAPTPGPWIKTARPLKWNLMTAAAAFSPDLPQALEVPGVRPFSMPPAVSVNNASCFGIKSEATSTVSKAETSGTSAKSDSAFTPAKAESPSKAAKADAPAKARTWTFSISIGGANPWQIKGTITEGKTEPPTAVGH